jgi:hypothetical protein
MRILMLLLMLFMVSPANAGTATAKKPTATKQPMVKKAAKQEKSGGNKFLIGGVVVGIVLVGAGVMLLGGRGKKDNA